MPKIEEHAKNISRKAKDLFWILLKILELICLLANVFQRCSIALSVEDA